MEEVVKQITIPYRPRKLLLPFHQRTQRWAVIVAHRRFGKTVGIINEFVKAAVSSTKNDARYGFFAPFYSQAKDIAWSYLRHYAGYVPGAQFHESELRCDIPNGSRIRLYGTENYDRIRGLGFDGVALDEFGDMDPRAWTEAIRPALSDRKGWATFIGTPKGQNHFYDMWDQAQGDPSWFTLMLKASQTGIIDEQELADARRMLTAEQYASEYECSFFGSVVGSYYGEDLGALESNGGIGDFGWLPDLAVSTAWDTGNTTSVWFFQQQGSHVRIVDYLEGVNQRADWYKKKLDDKPYTYAGHYVPADADDEKEIVGISWKESLEKLGVRNITVLPRQTSVDNGIQSCRLLIPRCRFNISTTKDGVTGLRNYRREWDDKRKIFRDTPRHDWASHPADGFRYLGIAVNTAVSVSDWGRPLVYKTKWVT